VKIWWNNKSMGRRQFLEAALTSGLGLSVGTSGRANTMGYQLEDKIQFDRCIILGMDGLDPQFVAALMRENKLPNFAKLADDGTFGPLQTSNPVMSPVAWSNIATGAGPGHHGIFDFIHRDPIDYVPYVSLRKSSDGMFGTRYERARQTDGFWRYTSDAGLPTTVIRWPVTFPPEKVNGRFLSGLGVPDLLGTEGLYTFFTTEPIHKDDPSPHNVVQVRWEQGKAGIVKTVLKGPMIGRGRIAEIPLIVGVKNADISSLQFGSGPAVVICLREWTPWIGITFKAGLRRIHGMVKLILLEVEPQFKLFVSPIHLDPADPAFDISYPAGYARSMYDQIGIFHTLGMPEMVHPLSHRRYGFDEFLAQVETVRKERKEMFQVELERSDKGVFAFVFDHTDRIQHAFWATRDPAHPMYDPREAQLYGAVIRNTYQEMDACLGEAIKRTNGRTLLLVVSDHGFSSFRRQVHLNRWLVQNGYMHLKESQDMEGRGIFQDVNWRNTRAYAVGFSSIYLNLVGREGGGIVKRDKQSCSLLDEIASKLQTLTDPDNGNRVIHKVYVSSRIYANSLLVEKGPDLVVGFQPGYRASWQTALGGAPTSLVEDNKSRWSGDHIFDPDFMAGIVLSNIKLKGKSFRGIDIAPTILSGLGLNRPQHMTGRNLLRF
jgi:predicted AlkP superfamily phosphohydrolase/phosphomutase